DDLERFLKGEPILARRTTLWERGLKWARRRPAAAALILVSLVSVLGLGLLYQEQQAQQEARERQRIEYQDQQAQQEARERQRIESVRREALELLLKGREAAATEHWQESKVALANAWTLTVPEPTLTELKDQAERLLAEANRKLEEQKELRRAEVS